MKKNIIISESQYNRIFLGEQDTPNQMVSDIPIQSDRLGPNSDFDYRMKSINNAIQNNLTHIPRHDSRCNSKWKQYCKKQNMVATNTTKKGKEWDILSGKATKDSKGNYNTLTWGEWDNENITKCRCQRGKVIISLDGQEKFVPEGATISQLNVVPGSPTDLYLKGKISDEQYEKEQMKQLRIFNSKIRNLEDDSEISKFVKGVADWLGGCTEDYHCVLDLLSIAALAIPGYGLLISFGLDAINASAYGIEYATAETEEDRNAAALAGILTLGGGFLGGGYKAMKNIKLASSNPKIYKYMGDIVGETEKKLGKVKSLKTVKDKKVLEDIYGLIGKKYNLSTFEQKLAHNLLNTFNKIDPKLIKKYSEALLLVNESVRKKTSYTLLNVFKESSWKKALQKENGDVLITLKKYMNKPLYRDVLVQIGAFLAVQEALEIPAVQEWIGEKYREGKYSINPGIRNRVEKDGYDWKMTKEIFGAISTDDSKYSFEKSREDNLKLEKAWNAGWRPFDKKIKEPTPLDFNEVPEKYQTKKYKERINNSVFDKKNVSLPIEVQKQIQLFNNDDNSNVDDKTKEQQQKKIITQLKSQEYNDNADYENFDLDDY